MLAPLPKGIGFGYPAINKQKQGIPPGVRNDTLAEHSGGNPGWAAHFLIDITKREGFVVADNSLLGNDLNRAVQRIWLNTVLNIDAGADPPPATGATVSVNKMGWNIAAVLGLLLLAAASVCGIRIARGSRRLSRPRLRRSLFLLAPPVLLLLVWWYLCYAPRSVPLPLPPTFLSVWRLPLIDYFTAVLLGWMGVALLFAFFPRVTEASIAADR